jgi:hypothetical protein
MLMPYLTSDTWKPDYMLNCVYSLLWLDAALPCPFKTGQTSYPHRRFYAHEKLKGSFVPLRLWPIAVAADLAPLEQQALAIVGRYATKNNGPECFAVPDLKKVLGELDRWATGAGLANVGPELKWRRLKSRPDLPPQRPLAARGEAADQ